MKRRKTTDELYKEVKDFDLVLVPDAALADALNRRIDRPRLGFFAETLKSFVIKSSRYRTQEAFVDEQEAVTRLAGKAGYRRADFYVSLLADCWLQRGSLDRKFIPVPEFLSIPGYVYEFLAEMPCYYSLLERFRMSGSGRVAVVEESLFAPLERNAIGEGAAEISLFTDEEAEYPSFCLFESPHDLAAAVAGEIREESQQQVAVVTAGEGIYSNVLKAKIRARGISVIGPRDIMEEISFRRTLSLLRMSLAPERLTVSDAAGLLSAMGAAVPPEKYGFFLKDYPEDAEGHERVAQLYRDMIRIGTMTFGAFIEAFPLWAGIHLRDIVKEYRMEARIIGDAFPDFEYFLLSFGSEIGSSRKGVVFADARGSLIVDRPVVFYVMPDNTWVQDNFSRLWMDRHQMDPSDAGERRQARERLREGEMRKHRSNLMKFASLVQSGSEKYFMACPRMGNAESAPCSYFQELGGPALSSFRDKKARFRWFSPRKGKPQGLFSKKENRSERPSMQMLSNSSLRTFLECPRRFSLGQIVPGRTEEPLLRGSLIHQFAELYALYPDFVRKKGKVFFVEMMMKEMAPLMEEAGKGVLRTHLDAAVQGVMGFLDRQSVKGLASRDAVKENPRTDRDRNVFLERLKDEMQGEKPRKLLAEVFILDPDLKMCGKIDLFVSDRDIVDYKTGFSVLSPYKIIDNADVRVLRNTMDFQCKMYLSLLRGRCPGKRLKIVFYHPLAGLPAEMAGNRMKAPDAEPAVEYVPQEFAAFAASRECFDELDDPGSKRRAFLDRLGYERYREIGRFPVPFDAEDKGACAGSEGARSFVSYCLSAVGSSLKKDAEAAEGVVKALYDARRRKLFKEDLDAFEKFVERQCAAISACHEKGFAAMPLFAGFCHECAFHDICDMRMSYADAAE